MRNLIAQFRKLLKEWSVKVEFLSIIVGIPIFSPPTIQTVDGERNISMVHGDHLLLAEIAGALVEMTFIPPDYAALLAAIGAKCWAGDWELLAKKDWTDIVKKSPLGWADLESFLAMIVLANTHWLIVDGQINNYTG